MILPFPFDDVVARLGETGNVILAGAELSEEDRVVASFACALMLWLAHNDPDYLWECYEKLDAEMAATEKPQ